MEVHLGATKLTGVHRCIRVCFGYMPVKVWISLRGYWESLEVTRGLLYFSRGLCVRAWILVANCMSSE